MININTEIYYSSDSLKEADDITLNVAQQTPEYLASLSDPNTPSHALPLKINAICAIQRNIAVEKGLVRNARVQIIALHRRFVEVRKLDDNEVHCLLRITFAFQPHGTDWTVIRKQFPLRLAYAVNTSCHRPSHRRICSWTALHRFIASPTSRRLPSHLLRRERRARQCQCSVQIPTAVMCILLKRTCL